MSRSGIMLGIDTATAWLSLAAADTVTGERLASVQLRAERQHASLLPETLRSLLADAGADLQDVTAIGVGTGPGSYTGLRVGLATAQGLATGLGCTLAGVDSLACAAFGQLTPGNEGWFAFDARRGNFYAGRYRRDGAGIITVSGPSKVSGDDLVQLAAADGLKVWTDPVPDALHAALSATAGGSLEALYL